MGILEPMTQNGPEIAAAVESQAGARPFHRVGSQCGGECQGWRPCAAGRGERLWCAADRGQRTAKFEEGWGGALGSGARDGPRAPRLRKELGMRPLLPFLCRGCGLSFRHLRT
jgi:hypothetical protein